MAMMFSRAMFRFPDPTLKARQARDIFTLAVPEFDEIEPSKEASDWNDLFRLIGFEKAKLQITESLGRIHR